jgi:quinol---cytochrome c reductase iron-sulfur subunit, bacillus type
MAETDGGRGADPPGPRRGFLKLVTVGLGALVAVVLGVPAVRFLVFPARRKTVDGPDDLVPVASADAVGDKPVRVEITTPQQRDAWAKAQNVRLGAAWLVKGGDGGIRAFSTTCPHLGCSVDYDAKADSFRCPCHTSAFDKAGNRVSGPAKRGLDPLEARVEDGRVLVRFRRFKLDVPEREGV